ncbi:MarR family transcriptional regulator [Staphylococcus epidermidis]|uniref:MarR family transcriptional regulator n=1 Tax=Staphylococcus epidermidis TaxID=1282 RepID=UPI0018792D07|nr:MarR family transcriptional regulator [Staphylococcus epidermidis]MBE7351642.1 MarR family transcriptional regulator [Staphylococcus epidermidis]MCG1059430.1 MarR family transcriptional regulator [Staphylococcus epidermidis]MCG1103236.1 MarR family transcriptional regulator [Staphylococcus epidermidis]MCG2086799.1 MarR family transcriptional regulator [Staphylococcus epidermidis]MCG2222007.1 MarR family transcriptional regulator [Staphylococcus epidermidis]
MFVGDKETLKDFILNYHNNVDDDYKDVSANEFFTLNDDVEEYSYQTIDADEHIFMNELDILVNRIADFREYNIFMLLCKGRTFNDIAQILEMSKTRVQQLFDGLLNKIIKQGA